MIIFWFSSLEKGIAMYVRMNNVTCPHAPPPSKKKKDVHVLMLGTCEHVNLHDTGSL